MTAVGGARYLRSGDLAPADAMQITSWGATFGGNPKPGREAEVEKALLGRHEHFECWRKADIPKRLHYGSHPRVPAIFCKVDLGWLISTPESAAKYRGITFQGNHGYDPAEPDMLALFVAHGPAFKKGVTVPAFDDIHLYPMLARVLGVKPEKVDGKWRR